MESIHCLLKNPTQGISVTSSACVTLGLVLVVVFAYRSRRRQRRLPPHVPGVPFFGNIFQMDPNKPYVSLTEWAAKYGDIYTIRVLNKDVVVINSRDLIREALLERGHVFAGRPYLYRIDYGFHFADDIIFGDYSAKWVHMKKIASQALRTYGSGLDVTERVVKEEMSVLVDIFEEQVGNNFDPRLTLMTAVVNTLTASLMGRRYDHEDPQMALYKETTRIFSEVCSTVNGSEIDLFPWLRFLPNKNFEKLTKARKMLDDLVDVELKSARQSFDSDNPTCLLDALFMAQEGKEDFRLSDSDVRCIFIDILVSGTFTTSIALSTFVLYMASFPDIQAKLREAIREHMGSKELPSGGDRQKLPIVEATFLEILRYISHVPLSLPHFTKEDVEFSGYYISKDTQIFLNLWKVHHDETLWENPWKFDPYRFLDNCGQLLPASHERRKSLLPFSAGRRSCMGETLARERLFLFATCLLQKFHFLPPDGEKLPSTDPRDFQSGLILEPWPFKVKVLKA